MQVRNHSYLRISVSRHERKTVSSLGGGPLRWAAVAATDEMATGAGAAASSGWGAGAGAACDAPASGTGAGAAAASAGAAAGARSGLNSASAGAGAAASWPLAEPMRAARIRQRITSTDEDWEPAISAVPAATRHLQ